MKDKISRDMVLFIILVPFLLWGAFFISSRMEGQMPAFTVGNKSLNGISVFYETMRALDYPVSQTNKPINNMGTRYLQFVAMGKAYNIGTPEAKKWVEDGGTLVFLIPGGYNFMAYGSLKHTDDNVLVYEYGKGTLVIVDVYDITNRAMVRDPGAAYALLEHLDKYQYEGIYFNESDFYMATTQKGLWDSIPMELKFILYQLLLAVCLYFYYKGKRFGKPIPLYEETERIENEYLYSAASLYKQAKCWDIMLGSYYKSLLKLTACNENGLLDYWRKENLPSLDLVQKVAAFIKNPSKKPKETMQIVLAIEQLKRIMNKRRDTYWKTLKTKK